VGLLTIISVQVRDFLNFCTKVMNNTVVIFDKTQQKQEAELSQSQRHRATLRVIEYFAKSLKFTQGRSK